MAQHGLPGRRVFRCSTAPTNPKGVAVRGKGYITYADSVSGQVVRWDLRGDEFEHIIGKEYLSAFHNVMRVGTISAAKIEFLGDSTTAGTGITASRFLLDQLVQDNLLAMGLGLNPIFVDRGVGGATTVDIRTVQVPLSITNAPHVVILRQAITISDPDWDRRLHAGRPTLRLQPNWSVPRSIPRLQVIAPRPRTCVLRSS